MTNLDEESQDVFFTTDDVLKTTDPLNRLLRIIMTTQGVDKKEYLARHYQYYRNEFMFTDPNLQSLATHRNNVRRSILGDRITWHNFMRIIENILPYEIVGLTAKLKNRETKDIFEFSSDMNYNEHKNLPADYDIAQARVTLKDLGSGRIQEFSDQLVVPEDRQLEIDDILKQAVREIKAALDKGEESK